VGELIPIVLPKAILINVDKMAREGQIHSRAKSRPLVQPIEIGADGRPQALGISIKVRSRQCLLAAPD
jgi:hypothetical protein